MKYIKKFATISQYNTYMSGTPYLPNVSLIADTDSVLYMPAEEETDWEREYLTFEAIDDCLFNFYLFNYGGEEVEGVSYSLDGGQTWSEPNDGIYIENVEVLAGNKIMWRGDISDNHLAEYTPGFLSTGRFNVMGNVLSLSYKDNFYGQSLPNQEHIYDGLFMGTGVVDVSNLYLPVANVGRCYRQMFKNCEYLTTAPVINDGELEDSCFESMFEGCSSLNYIKCLLTDVDYNNCTNNWVNGVAANGTFVKAAAMNDWTTGIDGIPSGWAVQNA